MRPPPFSDLQPGDVFSSEGGMGVFSAGIRLVERVHSRDNEATYGHAGLIIDPAGAVLDTLWTVQRTQLSRYAGQRVIIARPVRQMNGRPVDAGTVRLCLRAIEIMDAGRWYPAHRILLHLVPPLAKYVAAGAHKVCSERTAAYLADINTRPLPWAGATPDMLADEWRVWRNFDVLFEGVLPA
jgi:hypothetical protein